MRCVFFTDWRRPSLNFGQSSRAGEDDGEQGQDQSQPRHLGRGRLRSELHDLLEDDEKINFALAF